MTASSRTTLALTVLGLGLVAVAAAIVYAVEHGTSSTPAAAAPAPARRVNVVDGLTTVTLDAATQQRSGIEVRRVHATRQVSATTTFGTVLDLQPLLDLRNRYTAARGEARAAQAAADASREEFARTRNLYEDQQNASRKAFEAARARDDADRAKADAAALAVRNVEAGATQQFGAVLAGWALKEPSPELARLLRRTEVLARVTLPPGFQGPPPANIEVQPVGGQRVRAQFVSPSAQSDQGTTGPGMIYRVGAPVATGTPLVAILPASAQPVEGVFVPGSAVVWYAGQPWVYAQASATAFARKRLDAPVEMDDGYFVRDGLAADEHVVARGAQLLLSEEQRPPPGGATCKDPECD